MLLLLLHVVVVAPECLRRGGEGVEVVWAGQGGGECKGYSRIRVLVLREGGVKDIRAAAGTLYPICTPL